MSAYSADPPGKSKCRYDAVDKDKEEMPVVVKARSSMDK